VEAALEKALAIVEEILKKILEKMDFGD
jgi:hypothetical protein